VQCPDFECRYLIVPKVPDFSAGVSQYLLINIKLHKESDESRLTSLYPLLIARKEGKDFSALRELLLELVDDLPKDPGIFEMVLEKYPYSPSSGGHFGRAR
jgi:hypothetical protein